MVVAWIEKWTPDFEWKGGPVHFKLITLPDSPMPPPTSLPPPTSVKSMKWSGTGSLPVYVDGRTIHVRGKWMVFDERGYMYIEDESGNHRLIDTQTGRYWVG
jgi:hypothetical protein